MKEKCQLMWENHNEYVSEEVGHSHVTYMCKRIYAVSLWWFLNGKNFLGTFFDYPKGFGIIQKR